MRKCLFVLLAAAFLMVSAMPAMAQEEGAVSISGNVHLETFWNNRDSTLVQGVTGIPTASGDTDLLMQVQPVTTNLNFNFKQGDISAGIVGRPWDGFKADWWGSWNFGAGELIIGNINNPAWRPFASLSVRVANAAWYGAIDAVKQSDQITVVFPVGGGSLRIGAIKPADNPGLFAAGTDDTDYIIPKFEASYDFRLAGLHLWVGGGYQTYKEVVTATDNKYDVTSWLGALYASYGFGPVTLNGNYWMMKNPQAYGYSGNPAPFNSFGTPSLTVTNEYDAAKDDIVDVDYSGWHVSAGWKISDMLTLQAGYGMGKWKRDRVPATEIVDPEDTRGMYYVNMPIFAAKGFTVTPEIGVYDERDYKDGVTGLQPDQGKTTYYGVKWLIRF